nr:PQQ-dependent sugar dehydrogenase [Altererythrobacter sp. KTW20L]
MVGRRLAVCATLALLASPVLAQQPPTAVPSPPLSDTPYVFETAEVHPITVSVVAKGFARPFAFEFLPDGSLLVAERGGNLRLIRAATTSQAARDPQPIAGMPLPGTTQGSFGLHDLALHPDFASNGLVYWTWNVPVPNATEGEPPQQGRFSIMRGQLADGALSGVETVFVVDEPGYAGGTRIAFGPDGMLYVTTSAPFGPEGQDLASPYGKVLRLTADGAIPADNPFASQPNAHPAIYSLGHRDQHGLMVLPTGEVFSAEHGPSGGDELNLIEPGANYGWPAVTLGRNYDGSAIEARRQADGMVDPLVAWLPSIAPSGLLHYTGDAFPAWQGNLFIGSSRRGGVNGTGGLERVVFGEDWGELRRETLLTPLHQRVRDVAQGPDGLVYVLTDGPEMAVLRLAPAP